MRQKLTAAKSKSRKGKKGRKCNYYYILLQRKEKHAGELGSFLNFTNFHQAPALCQVVFQALGMPQRTR